MKAETHIVPAVTTPRKLSVGDLPGWKKSFVAQAPNPLTVNDVKAYLSHSALVPLKTTIGTKSSRIIIIQIILFRYSPV